MLIKCFVTGPYQTNTYVIGDESTEKALVIDPTAEACCHVIGYLKEKNLNLEYIINTHFHPDHIGGNEFLKKETLAQIGHKGEQLVLGTLTFKIMRTPGHTPDDICLYEEKEKVLFSGDTLFAGTHGRTDLPGGNEAELYKSLTKLGKLPVDVKVYPGHGPETTIGKENWIKSLV